MTKATGTSLDALYQQTVDQNQEASTNDPRVIGIPSFFLYSFQAHGISKGDTLEHNRSYVLILPLFRPKKTWHSP